MCAGNPGLSLLCAYPRCSAIVPRLEEISSNFGTGLQVRVLGEGFTPEDEEDSAAAEVSKVWAYQARYRVPLAKAVAGLPSSACPE